MHTYIVDESNTKKAVVIPIDEYEQLTKALNEYKKRLDELEDELDIKLATDAIKNKNERIPFDITNYV